VRKPVFYTFGNHMHWVDMEWLWGYEALSGSVRDMLRLIDETGARGNVNFDAIAYEKMASEAPEALAELKGAVAAGRIEVVGATYGQPYGLFQGGESNVRQLLFGARAVLRLLGVRPRAFWEEEFTFFPQLPQILRGCGYTGASLFFQWTWHTPEVPRETRAAVVWEGIDGSRIPALARTDLCLHQWPEDFAGLLDGAALREMEPAAIVQWLELMPSRDWMCRSEVLLPRLRELLSDPRFEVRCTTLSGLLEALRAYEAPVRRYGMDEVFHGTSLGKNGDHVRRRSRCAERQLLAAEAASSLAGLLGRPYPSWDVYPSWELDEAWRELLSAQHHDNEECEGLCGFVGERSFDRSLGLSAHVLDRTVRHLASRSTAPAGHVVAFNPLGWERDVVVRDASRGRSFVVPRVPAFGIATLDPERALAPPRVDVEEDGGGITLSRGSLRARVDRKRGVLVQVFSPEFPDGVLDAARPLADVEMVLEGRPERFPSAETSIEREGARPVVVARRRGRDGATVCVRIALGELFDGVEVEFLAENLPRPDPGMHAGLQTTIAPALSEPTLLHDTPYAISPIDPQRSFVRKYPTGDWMTSPQVFEEIRRPFTAFSLLNFVEGDRGILVLHDGSQAFFRDEGGVRNLLTLYDPWDESFWRPQLAARLAFVPHGPLTNAQRWRWAAEFEAPRVSAAVPRGGGDVPATFGPLCVEGEGVSATALHRENPWAGERIEGWAGRGMGHPYVVRLVEFDGKECDVRIRVPGPLARAVRTNLMGEPQGELRPEPADPPPWGSGEWAGVRLRLRPREIATVYLDLVRGRKVDRNLDAYRDVWATVHKDAHSAREGPR
jgi:alpha-mannosidase